MGGIIIIMELLLSLLAKRNKNFEPSSGGWRRRNGMDCYWLPQENRYKGFIGGKINGKMYLQLVSEQIERNATKISGKKSTFQ